MSLSDLYRRYRSTFDSVMVSNDIDSEELAADMIRCNCELRTGKVDGSIEYKGMPADFPCYKFLAEYPSKNER